jgi:hypothetical protein
MILMGCLFAMFAAAFPRIATLIMWLARPERFAAAFGDVWLWPILGIIVLPYTTLMYVLLWAPAVGLYGFDYFWLMLGVVLDIGNLVGSGWANRRQLGTAFTTTGPI